MNKKEILGLCEFLKLHGFENTDNISRFIFGLQQENKQLKYNWNKLKELTINSLYFYGGYQGEDLETYIVIESVLDKIQELEQGSDSNGQ